MKGPYRYQIINVQLTDGMELPTGKSTQLGLYLIFWWKQIPVGHLYIRPDEMLNQEDLKLKSVSTILATLNAYIADKQPALTDDQLAAQLLDPDSLTELLEIVLGPYHMETFPESVPVTVIICTRNRSEHLRSCLSALQTMVCQPAEIIVVDNAPTDGLTEQVVHQFKGVTYCREPRPGLDIARNAGIRAARSPIIAYTDDDVIVHPLWIYQIWQTFMDPQVEAVTGLIIASELATQAQLIFEMDWSFNRGYLDKYYDINYFNRTLASGPPVWEIGAGANMAFRRTLFDEIGYFDERLDVGAAGCSGDSEIWYRTLAHGHSIQYNPRAVVYHKHRQELGDLQKQLYNYMRGHAVAALIQQAQTPQAGYYRHLSRSLFRYGYSFFRNEFSLFSPRHPTFGIEIKGILSGLLFYIINRKRPSQSLTQ